MTEVKSLLVGVSLGCAAFSFNANAHAAWKDRHVVEGDSAYTVPSGSARLSLLGRSAIALGGRAELSTYLPLDVLLFPNLSLKYRFYEGDVVALALKGGVGGGLYPVAAGITVPFGAVVGGAGLVGAAYQNVDLTLSVTPAEPITLSLRGGVLRAEYGFKAAIGAAGGGGAGGGVISQSGHMNVPNGGLELDAILGPRNAVIVEAEAYGLAGDTVLFVPYLGWYHAFGEHFHLVVGGATLVKFPRPKSREFEPLPYVNVYWNIGG